MEDHKQEMHKYEVRGWNLREKEQFVLITPPVLNAYQARLYTIGYLDDVVSINQISRIME